jgi:enoyl-CoA hydratase/carnithine racemase
MSDLGEATKEVLVENEDGVLRLTLNRPEVLNAITSRTYVMLREALDLAAEDPGIRCVLLTGTGRAFTAGLDLTDDEGSVEERWAIYDAFVQRFEGLGKPLVVAVNGLAVGIGVTMLGHADIVLAAQSARFRMPFVPLGLGPEAGSSYTMPALMGRQNAAHALFTGDWLSASEAAASGLVRTVVPDDALAAEALALCTRIAAMPVASLVATKQMLLANRLEAARLARAREERVFLQLQSGPDHAEVLAAFAEKRKPVFRRPVESGREPEGGPEVAS